MVLWTFFNPYVGCYFSIFLYDFCETWKEIFRQNIWKLQMLGNLMSGGYGTPPPFVFFLHMFSLPTWKYLQSFPQPNIVFTFPQYIIKSVVIFHNPICKSKEAALLTNPFPFYISSSAYGWPNCHRSASFVREMNAANPVLLKLLPLLVYYDP